MTTAIRHAWQRVGEEEEPWSAEVEIDDEDTVEEPAVVAELTVTAWLRELCPCDGCLFEGPCQEIPPVLNPVHAGATT